MLFFKVTILAFLLILIIPCPVFGKVILNEIAWMGDEISWRNEWIELYSDQATDISGWTIENATSNNKPLEIKLSVINGYLVIEKSYYTKLSLHNSYQTNGELILKNSQGQVVDRTGDAKEWPAGDNETKRTMERSGLKWQTSQDIGGTKNKENSSPNYDLVKKPMIQETKTRKNNWSLFVTAIIVALISAIIALSIKKLVKN